MSKELKFNEDAIDSVGKGVNMLANAVKSTLGPRGRNVIIARKFGGPVITKDGVSVAREIDLKDEFENMGALMVREAASKTNDEAGDGTTTATIIAQEIFNKGKRLIATGMNPLNIKKGIDIGINQCVGYINEVKQSIGDDDLNLLHRIAVISSNGEEAIADLIIEAVDKTFRDSDGNLMKEGSISVKESSDSEDKVDVSQGYQFSKGWISQSFAKPGTKEIVLNEAYVLLYDGVISNQNDLIQVAEFVSKGGKPVLVIADGVESGALALMVMNNAQGNLKCCAVRPPAFGKNKMLELEDIAIITGATIIKPSLGHTLVKTTKPEDNGDIKVLGYVKEIRVSNDKTTIIEGIGGKEAIEDRAEEIRESLKDSDLSEHDKNCYEKRLAKLVAGIAEISIGGKTETEARERKMRVDDAVSSVLAALDDGYVMGGGMALINAGQSITDALNLNVQNIADGTEYQEVVAGLNLVRDATRSPFKTLCRNAGEPSDVILYDIEMTNDVCMGFDIKKGKVVDMYESGILDPAKVVKSALTNGATCAAMLLTSSVAIVDIPEENKGGMGMPPMGY